MTPATKAVQNAHAERWTRLDRAAPDHVVQFRVSLATTKSDTELESLVSSLSDVASPSYGQYLQSHDALAAHWTPHDAALDAIAHLEATIESLDVHANNLRDVWTLRMHARDAESLFAAQLHAFAHHRHANLTVVRPHATYSIPSSLAPHVLYIDGLESFPTEMQAQFMARRSTHQQDRDPLVQHQHTTAASIVTPAMIRTQYDIPATANASHALNTFVIGTFLHEFYAVSDLTTFLQRYDPLNRHTQRPTTRGDCLVDASSSSRHKATGEASLDIQVAMSIAHSDQTQMFCYTGLRDNTRPEAADNQEPFLTFMQDINAMIPPPAVVSISYTDDECAVPRAYALAVNRELMKAALRGTSILISAGDAGSLGSHLASFCGGATCDCLRANFPASSPFVTAVGATTLVVRRPLDAGTNKWQETVTSTAHGALITSGGGFSLLFDRPTYQQAAVASYNTAAGRVAGLSGRYNSRGRAYPDITAVGHAFPVIENGRMYPTDGTSVSAPLLAAMIALVNSKRLAAKKPTLGFLNPLLYDLHATCPHVFSDIVEGDTKCGTPDMGCCPYGHFATTGWDAASGVGTMRFATFVDSLDGCIEHIQAVGRGGGEREPVQLLAVASENAPTMHRQHLLLLSAAVVAGVALLSVVIVAFRRWSLVRSTGNVREPAREYLLARDASRP